MNQPLPFHTRDDLASLLASRIASGELPPGTALPSERSLAEEYRLSRSMVREALRVLAERRLIEVVPGRGSFVRATTVDDAVERMIEVFDHRGVTLRSLIEARAMIETTAPSLAAERASDHEILGITAAFESCRSSREVIEQVQWDLAFHQAIVRAAGNTLVLTMFRALQPYIVELLIRSLTDADVTREGLAFHTRILRAIRDGDSASAEREMRDHLLLGLTMFGTDVDRSLNLVAREAMQRMTSHPVTFDDLLRLTGDRTPQQSPAMEMT
jgi:DNA-binding FadR family transcriptional regulator